MAGKGDQANGAKVLSPTFQQKASSSAHSLYDPHHFSQTVSRYAEESFSKLPFFTNNFAHCEDSPGEAFSLTVNPIVPVNCKRRENYDISVQGGKRLKTESSAAFECRNEIIGNVSRLSNRINTSSNTTNMTRTVTTVSNSYSNVTAPSVSTLGMPPQTDDDDIQVVGAVIKTTTYVRYDVFTKGNVSSKYQQIPSGFSKTVDSTRITGNGNVISDTAEYNKEYMKTSIPTKVVSYQSKMIDEENVYTKTERKAYNVDLRKDKWRFKCSENTSHQLSREPGNIVNHKQHHSTQNEQEIIDFSLSEDLLSECFKWSTSSDDEFVEKRSNHVKSVAHLEEPDKSPITPNFSYRPVYNGNVCVSSSLDLKNYTNQSSDTRSVSNNSEVHNSLQRSVQNSNTIDFPITEMRKILDTVQRICPAEKEVTWKNNETFAYSHTQNVTVGKTASDHNLNCMKTSTTHAYLCNNTVTSHENEKTCTVSKRNGRTHSHQSNELCITNHAKQTDSESMCVKFVEKEFGSNGVDEKTPDNYNLYKKLDSLSAEFLRYKDKRQKTNEHESPDVEETPKESVAYLQGNISVSTKKMIDSDESEKTPDTARKCINEFPHNDSISNKVDAEKRKTYNLSSQIDEQPFKFLQKNMSLQDNRTYKVNGIFLEDRSAVLSTNIFEDGRVENRNGAIKSNEVILAECERQNGKSTGNKSIAMQDYLRLSPAEKDSNFKIILTEKPAENSDINITTECNKQSVNAEKANSDRNENNRNIEGNVPFTQFYGKRMTNRGSFLTESRKQEHVKKTRSLDKKSSKISCNSKYTPTEEFHAMVKTPDIDITPSIISSCINADKPIIGSHKKSEFLNKISKDVTLQNSRFNQPSPNKEKCKHTVTSANVYSASVQSYKQNNQPSVSSTPTALSQQLNSNNDHTEMSSRIYNAAFYHRNSNVHNGNYLMYTPYTSHQLAVSNYYQLNMHHNNVSAESIGSANEITNSPAITYPNDGFHQFPGYFYPNGNALQHDSLNYLGQTLQKNFADKHNTALPSVPGASVWCGSPQLSTSTYNSPTSSPGLSSLPSSCQKEIGHISKTSSLSKTSPRGASPSPFQKKIQSTVIVSKSCLVPQDLKTRVGHKLIDRDNLILLILQWSIEGIMHQENSRNPPPINKTLRKVVGSYNKFEDYYNTYFPLMLEETRYTILSNWTACNKQKPCLCEINSYSVKENFINVECKTVFDTSASSKMAYPAEGSILVVKFAIKPTKTHKSIKVLGYVTTVKCRNFKHLTDSKICGYESPKSGNHGIWGTLQVLSITFMAGYNFKDIDTRAVIGIRVLCNVSRSLKENDGLLYLKQSPVCDSILNPIKHRLRTIVLKPRNSDSETISNCVKDITDGISSPKPSLTIVKTTRESDKLNIIPKLVNDLKVSYNTKVLLCTKTSEALNNVAANICLHDTLKLVITCKHRKTDIQFQKYLLDELVHIEVNESHALSTRQSNEAVANARKNILQECDVVLSLIQSCHEQAFIHSENAAQACCIIDEANLCTEPETLIPLMYGFSKVILIGDPDHRALVSSKIARLHEFDRSLFHRVYDLDPDAD